MLITQIMNISMATVEGVHKSSRTQKADARNILKDTSGAKTFYLTFDAHDDNTNIDYILDTLKKNNIKATFFLTGTFIRMYPEDARRIAAEGHTVGNHTFSHPYFRNGKQLVNELKDTEDLFFATTGQHMSKIWRAPYLQHISNKKLLAAAESIGYTHVDVSLCTTDWVDEGEPQYMDNEKFMDYFTTSLDCAAFKRIHLDGTTRTKYAQGEKVDHKGVIMLMHGGSYRTNGADFVCTLDAVIDVLKQEQYEFKECNSFLE